MIDLNLLILFFLAVGLFLAFYVSTKNIQYYGTNTDNQKQVQVASESRSWFWLSDMHKSEHSKTKTYMKDALILLLVIFQKLTGDDRTDHPLVSLHAFAHGMSAILIYLISKNYWDTTLAMYIALAYLLSMWMWKISMMIGHIILANMFFFFSVFLLQQGDSYYWLMASGTALCLLFFSSSSARKFYILFLIAIFHERFGFLLSHARIYDIYQQTLAINYTALFNLYLPALTAVFLIIFRLNLKKIISGIYNEQFPSFINRIMGGRNAYPLGHYLKRGREKFNDFTKKITVLLLSFLLVINFIGFRYLLLISSGFIIVFLIFTLPNVWTNLGHYFQYYYLSKTSKSRYKLYPLYFGQVKKQLPFKVYRASWDWVIKYFFKMTPGLTLLSIILFTALLSVNLIQKNYYSIILLFTLTISSVSPIILGEVTKGPQVGRSYVPGFIGLLLFLGFALNSLKDMGGLLYDISWISSLALLGIEAVRGWLVFTTDVLPARMASTKVLSELKRLNIREFYTYNNNYNNAFIFNIDPEIIKNFKINFISSINDVRNGWILIPGTSSKAVNMESEMASIVDGDFKKDPLLNEIIKTKEIERIAEAKFKTFGSSKFWVHESEITSFRDLIAGDINDNDRFRGYGWLINAEKLTALTHP